MENKEKGGIIIQKTGEYTDFFINGDSSAFDSSIREYISKGMNIIEISDKFIPISPFYGEFNPMSIRLFNVMCKYHAHFNSILSRFYPFSTDILKEFQECLDWSKLLKNEFLNWSDEELLTMIKAKCHSDLVMNSNIGFYILMAKYKSCGCSRDSVCENESLISKAIEMGFIRAVDYHLFDSKKDKLYENSSVCLNPPKELEEILSQIEQNCLGGDDFDSFVHDIELIDSLFYLDNQLKNGFDYTFNTPEKKLIIAEAVYMFLVVSNNELRRDEIIREIEKSIERISSKPN